MLSQIVRPLVKTQVKLLANSQATQVTLTDTIAKWLSYLGIRAQINSLKSETDTIKVSLTVGKPEGCRVSDWQQILHQLHSEPKSNLEQENVEQMELIQQLQIIRFLAYLIQVGQSEEKVSWAVVKPQLISLELDEYLLEGIHSALKIPQSVEFIKKLEPDVAAQVLPSGQNSLVRSSSKSSRKSGFKYPIKSNDLTTWTELISHLGLITVRES